jgi:hypothetical protein
MLWQIRSRISADLQLGVDALMMDATAGSNTRPPGLRYNIVAETASLPPRGTARRCRVMGSAKAGEGRKARVPGYRPEAPGALCSRGERFAN